MEMQHLSDVVDSQPICRTTCRTPSGVTSTCATLSIIVEDGYDRRTEALTTKRDIVALRITHYRKTLLVSALKVSHSCHKLLLSLIEKPKT
jgi:hypothetical protein